MNETEKRFYEAFLGIGEPHWNIVCNYKSGCYIANFLLYPYVRMPLIVLIDYHNDHATPEQTKDNYRKERYFTGDGNLVVNFMELEIRLCARKCAIECFELACYENGKDKIRPSERDEE